MSLFPTEMWTDFPGFWQVVLTHPLLVFLVLNLLGKTNSTCSVLGLVGQLISDIEKQVENVIF